MSAQYLFYYYLFCVFICAFASLCFLLVSDTLEAKTEAATTLIVSPAIGFFVCMILPICFFVGVTLGLSYLVAKFFRKIQEAE